MDLALCVMKYGLRNHALGLPKVSYSVNVGYFRNLLQHEIHQSVGERSGQFEYHFCLFSSS